MKVILESEQFVKTLKRMTHQIIEYNDDLSKVILVGIETKGVPIAREIGDLILQFEGVRVPVESIDITPYRDDHKKNPEVKTTFREDINGKIIILVDDVFFTGRSVRAALSAILDIARPDKIELAVFIDRGHRELPIRADFVGKNLPTGREEIVVCDFVNKQVSIK